MTHFKTLLTVAGAALATVPAAAWAFPSNASFISERSELGKADLATHGVLAFTAQNETGLSVHADFSHESADKGYRIDFSPAFSNTLTVSVGPFKVKEKKIAKDMVSDSIALYLLPPGTYTSRHLFSQAEKEGQRPGRKAEGATFTITVGEITNLGTVTITAEKKLLSRKVWLTSDIGTAPALEAALRALPDTSLARLPVSPGQVSLFAE